MRKRKDRSGERHGRLRVVRFVEFDHDRRALWECECNCGEWVVVVGSNLGRVINSCGCLRESMSSMRARRIVQDRIGEQLGDYVLMADMGMHNERRMVDVECGECNDSRIIRFDNWKRGPVCRKCQSKRDE
jgi:hypothetical protein